VLIAFISGFWTPNRANRYTCCPTFVGIMFMPPGLGLQQNLWQLQASEGAKIMV